MQPLIEKQVTVESACSYLTDKEAQQTYKFIIECPNEYGNALLKRGWRRFGRTFFRPECPNCHKCETMRINVNTFTPTKSMRRIIRKNDNTRIFLGRPTMNNETLELYNRFHKERSLSRGWEYTDMTAEAYYRMAIEGMMDFGYEARYIIDNKLVGIDLIDIYKDAISSIYFFSDPDFNTYSLGTFSLLQQLQWAKHLHIPYVYPGYVVRENASLAYKLRFTPFETLQNRPHIHEELLYRED